MATPVVTLANLANVLIDGVPSGAVTDVIANRPNGVTPSAVLAAVSAWHGAEVATQVAAEAAKHILTNEALTAQLADLQASSAAQQAVADAQVADLKSQIADLESVLGGTEVGQALIAQRDAERRAAEKAALQARLDEINATAEAAK